MSNYPNMSYCQCENTLAAIKQVIENMQYDGLDFVENMSQEEKRAYHALYEACEMFKRLALDIEDEQAQEELDDEPDVDEAQEWHDFDPDC